MKITKRNITEKDIKEFESIYSQLTRSIELAYLDDEKIIEFFVDKSKVLTIGKVQRFFKADSKRIFNYEKI